MKRVIPIILIILLLCSCKKSNTEVFLFSSGRSGNSDIYLMNTENLLPKQLTNSPHEEWGPTWITENEISFLRQKGDKITRHKLNLETGKESVLQHPENCILDDKNILYSTNKTMQLYSCKSDIFLIDQKSGTTTNITSAMKGVSAYPSWSIDGKQVIFTNNQSVNNQIFTIDVKTKSITQLTDFEANNERGELSPDTNHLLFSSDKDEKRNQDIFLLNIKTGSLENITNSKGTELIARWSANGEHIYFGSNKDGNWELYRYRIEDKSTQRITNNDAFDGDPRIYKH